MKAKLHARSVITTLALAGSLLVAGALPSQAAGRDGVCDAGEFCYYYNSNFAGSISDFTSSVANYGTTQPSCYDFKGAGSGKGLCIKNRAASAWNRSGQTVRVFYNSNYGGTYQDIAPGAKANLVAALKNENASHQFLTPVTPPPVTPPVGSCTPHAVYVSQAPWGGTFDATATCTGVPSATLTMKIAYSQTVGMWGTWYDDTKSYSAPTAIDYGTYFTSFTEDWSSFWVLARVCWPVGQTTVCRDDYASVG